MAEARSNYTDERNQRLEENYETRYRAVKVLRSAKKFMKLRELSDLTGISIPLISRYINHRLLPNYGTAKTILERILTGQVLSTILVKSLVTAKVSGGAVYNLDVAASDPDLLYLIAEYIARDVKEDFDIIVTPEVGGITFANALSMVTDKRLVIASKRRPINGDYIEVPVIKDPTHIEYYYLRRSLLSGARKAIIVDDFSVRGATIRALVEALESHEIDVVAIYLIVALGDEWQKIPKAKALLTLA